MKATNSASGMPPKRRSKFRRFLPVYLMALPGVIYLFINNYMPLPGLVLAFKNYSAKKRYFWFRLGRAFQFQISVCHR